MEEVIKYTLSNPLPHRRYLYLEATIPAVGPILEVQLPSWRPGRYELGDFAKYIHSWEVTDLNGNPLQNWKVRKDRWRINTAGNDAVRIRYRFYCHVLNAGSSWVDEHQIYVNPVNCLLYDPERDLPYEIELDVTANYQIAGSMRNEGNKLFASGIQEVMDSPFIASDYMLDHYTYREGGCLFHIWIKGAHDLDAGRMVDEFERFTRAQVKAFGDIPCEEYHFLFLLLPYPAYHGVEHERSTVITLGPAAGIYTSGLYKELLGVSCHELYHTWNIKHIRPAEMMPYRFDEENYSRLGYVAEGVTTYFGDQFLHRSGIISDQDYFNELSTLIQRHMDNPGRFNLSVADSSFDTWLDGYMPGIPWRKVSIYNEGALCAFICDVQILAATDGTASLDDAMRLMYERFGKMGKGYTEQDYRLALEETSGLDFASFFEHYIHGTEDYLPEIERCLKLLGLVVGGDASTLNHEAFWGIRVDEEGKITVLLPDSPADQAKLWIGDRIISVGGHILNHNLSELSQFRGDGKISLCYERNGEQHETVISETGTIQFRNWRVYALPELDPQQKTLFEAWKHRNT